MSVNMVVLVGNLGKDPEVRFTQTGKAVANFSIATSEKWKGQDGQNQEKTEWHNIVVWGNQAEACGRYLSKGRQVFVQGRLQTRKWTDQNGQDRYTTEVVAQRVQFLGGGGQGQGTGGQGYGDQGGGQYDPTYGQPPAGGIDDDIPF